MKTYTLKVGDIIVDARFTGNIGYTELGKIEKIATKTATCSNVGKVLIEANIDASNLIRLQTKKRSTSAFCTKSSVD